MRGKARGKICPTLESLEPRRLLAVVYVDLNSPTTSGNGTSWATAFTSLQTALSIAPSGSQIRVADGIYKPTDFPDRSASFQLRDNISILGGYAGYGASNPDARDTINRPTILSGDIGAAGVNTDNSYHVVTASGVGSAAVLDGVTITAGDADGSGDPAFSPEARSSDGGGMLITNGSPTINNCTFTSNAASYSNGVDSFYHDGFGGAVFINGFSSPIFSACVFKSNSATFFGGGAADMSSITSTFGSCLFFSNTAQSGAGMYSAANSQVINCTFTQNTATSDGGGFFYDSSQNNNNSATLSNCIIRGNSAPFDPDLENEFASGNIATVNNSDVNGNTNFGTGDFNLDPMFVNPAANNFRLQSSSLCINTGSNVALQPADKFILDLDGNSRIQFNFVDLGAYESTVNRMIFVDAAATGANNGTSWADAFTDLLPALAATHSGETILMARGRYNHAPNPSSATYQINNNVSVYGGYLGGSVNPFSRDVVANPTILENTDFDNNGVAAANNDTVGTTLDGLEFESVTSNAVNGCGISVQNSSLTLNNCTFLYDNSVQNGGGIYLDSKSSLAASNCSFQNCMSGNGGAIYNDGGTLSVQNSTFSNNMAFNDGAAIDSNSNHDVTLTNCTFTANTSTDGGAVGASGFGNLTIVGSIFTGNSASSGGSGGRGGAVYVVNVTAKLINDTFTKNTSAFGGAIYNFASLTITNCIVWGDTSFADQTEISGGAVISYSDVAGGAAGAGNINADPLFIDASHGNFQLRGSSPCVNTGSNAVVTQATDVAGHQRIIGGTVEMGALEFVPVLFAQTGSYLYNAPRPTVSVAFNLDLNPATIAAGDLTLTNTTLHTNIDTNSLATASYNSATRTASWAFNTQLLPDGNYTAKIPIGSVSDTSGDELGADFTFNFFVLAGDANHDGKVDVTDLGVLATNWQSHGKTFAQGDFNYSGSVDVTDLGILASNWQKNNVTFAAPANALPMPSLQSLISPPPVTPARPPSRPDTRLVNSVV